MSVPSPAAPNNISSSSAYGYQTLSQNSQNQLHPQTSVYPHVQNAQFLTVPNPQYVPNNLPPQQQQQQYQNLSTSSASEPLHIQEGLNNWYQALKEKIHHYTPQSIRDSVFWDGILSTILKIAVVSPLLLVPQTIIMGTFAIMATVAIMKPEVFLALPLGTCDALGDYMGAYSSLQAIRYAFQMSISAEPIMCLVAMGIHFVIAKVCFDFDEYMGNINNEMASGNYRHRAASFITPQKKMPVKV